MSIEDIITETIAPNVVKVDPSVYCLTRVGREALPLVEVNAYSQDGVAVYGLSFPLAGSLRGVFETEDIREVMGFYNGMCLGAVVKATELEESRIEEYPSEPAAEGPVGDYPTETEGEPVEPAGQEARASRKVFMVGCNLTCPDCGRYYPKTLSEDDLVDGQYILACSCGNSALTWFDFDGNPVTKWTARPRPTCPIDPALSTHMDRIHTAVVALAVDPHEGERCADTINSVQRDLGAAFYALYSQAYRNWLRESTDYDREFGQE